MTSREAAAIAYGESAVRTYELVKRFYSRYGLALERTFASAVGGRLGERGRAGERGEPDVVTELGGFEFLRAGEHKERSGSGVRRPPGRGLRAGDRDAEVWTD